MSNYHLKDILDAEIRELISIKESIDINTYNFKNFLCLKYNKDFYENIEYEISKTDKFCTNKKHMVMVGSGYLPLTLIAYSNYYPRSNFLGLDINEAAVLKSEELKQILKSENIFFERADGLKYDYKMMDVIIIAAMVKNKLKMLDRIIETCKIGTKIFVRLFYKSDYKIINKLGNNKVKMIYRIDKNVYPKKEEYDLVVFEMVC